MGDGQTKQASPEIKKLEKPFRDFLAGTRLLEHFDKDHWFFLHRTYGANDAFLGGDPEPLKKAVHAFWKVYAAVSREAIRQLLQDSAARLFEQEAVREDADPEVEAQLDCLLDILDESAVEAELIALAERVQSAAQPATVFVPIEGLVLRVAELQIGRVGFYPLGSGPFLEHLDQLPTESPWAERRKIPEEI